LAKDSTEAFDIITAGMQQGVDKAGDLLDTLTEYAPQFSKLGLNGKQTLGVLSSFLKAGARDTDVAADAFKEFSLLAIDGSKKTLDGYKSLGLNGKQMGKDIAAGGDTATRGLDTVIKKLQGVKDPMEQNRIGVELFGTMWEDTVRTILPNLGSVTDGIKGVDGSTQKMADTIGDNAQGKIDTMKRGFEQWTQKMAGSTSAMGLAATGVAEFGGGALQAGSQIAMMATAMMGLNTAMLLNPIGLVVAAIALLVGGMVLLWKNSQKAREIMSQAFAGISTAVLTMVDIALKAYKGMSNTVLTVVETILRALGKIPGNEWADRAADDVKGFKDQANKFFDLAIGKTQDWKKAAQNLPKKIKLEGDYRNLQDKINHAKASLKSIPRSHNSKILADIRSAQRAAARIRAQLLGIKDRYVSVFVSEVQRDRATAGRGGKATGGIIGAATGGARGGLVEVGEHGRELVKLPWGSMVIPHGAAESKIGLLSKATKAAAEATALAKLSKTAHGHSDVDGIDALSKAAKKAAKSRLDALAAALKKGAKSKSGKLSEVLRGHTDPEDALSAIIGGHASAVTPIRRLTRPGGNGRSGNEASGSGECCSNCRVTLEIRSAGSRMDDFLVEMLRKAVRAQGGNVQLVLGKGPAR
jgi:hypothetical protein